MCRFEFRSKCRCSRRPFASLLTLYSSCPSRCFAGSFVPFWFCLRSLPLCLCRLFTPVLWFRCRVHSPLFYFAFLNSLFLSVFALVTFHFSHLVLCGFGACPFVALLLSPSLFCSLFDYASPVAFSVFLSPRPFRRRRPKCQLTILKRIERRKRR